MVIIIILRWRCRYRHLCSVVCSYVLIISAYMLYLLFQLSLIPHDVRSGGILRKVMATLQPQPPGCFNFKQLDKWLKWNKRFEQFRVAFGLSTEDDAHQMCMLLYCLGKEAEDVLKSMNITEDERKVYATILGKFDVFFQVRKT